MGGGGSVRFIWGVLVYYGGRIVIFFILYLGKLRFIKLGGVRLGLRVMSEFVGFNSGVFYCVITE